MSSAGVDTAVEVRIARLAALAPAVAVLCDVDGTLAPIVARPSDSVVPQRTRELLSSIADRVELLACVSGRRALEVRELVGLDGIIYVGNHGFELLEPGAAQPTGDPAFAGREGAAAAFVDGLDHPRLEAMGVRTEDKGPIQALHWRGAAVEAGAELLVREVAALAQSAGLVSRWGRKVLEVRPVAGIDKGSAVHGLIRSSTARGALYAGDDRTDLDAFRALRWLAGSGRLDEAVCVGVASDEGPVEIRELADVLVEGPEGIVEVLAALAAALPPRS